MRFKGLYEYIPSDCTGVSQPEVIAHTEEEWIKNHIDKLDSLRYYPLDDYETAGFFAELFPEDTVANVIDQIPEVFDNCMHLRDGGDSGDIEDYATSPCVLVREYRLKGNPIRNYEIIGVCEVGIEALGMLVELLAKSVTAKNPFDEAAQKILDKLDKLPIKELTDNLDKLKDAVENKSVIEVPHPEPPCVIEEKPLEVEKPVIVEKYKSRLRLFKNRY